MREGAPAGKTVANPYYLQPEARTNKRFLRLVRRRMILRAVRKQVENPQGSLDFQDARDVSDDDGVGSGGVQESDGSGDEDVEKVAEAMREAVDIVRDELPTGDDVDGLASGSDAWASATAEQLLSAARPAHAAHDVSLGFRPSELHTDGVSVNPRGYAWHLLDGNVDASADKRFKQNWAAWREAGTAARGDGCSYEELDVWARFAYKIAMRKADERDAWRGAEEGRGIRRQRVTAPLRMIVTGGAGSGKSTTIRALVRARREKTASRLTHVRNDKLKQGRMKHTCILASPTGTASFQMKYGATTAHRAWGISPYNFVPLKKGNPDVKRLEEICN